MDDWKSDTCSFPKRIFPLPKTVRLLFSSMKNYSSKLLFSRTQQSMFFTVSPSPVFSLENEANMRFLFILYSEAQQRQHVFAFFSFSSSQLWICSTKKREKEKKTAHRPKEMRSDLRLKTNATITHFHHQNWFIDANETRSAGEHNWSAKENEPIKCPYFIMITKSMANTSAELLHNSICLKDEKVKWREISLRNNIYMPYRAEHIFYLFASV